MHTTSGECSVNGVERDVVDGVHERLVLGIGSRVTTVAFEREVISVRIKLVRLSQTKWA